MTHPGGRPRRADLDRSILECTITELGERGYSALRIDDIVAATGIAKTTIYRRWPSLRHVVVAAMERAVGSATEPAGDCNLDRVEQLVFQRYSVMDSRALLSIALDLLQSDDAELRQRYRERVIDPVRDRVISLFGAAVDKGEISGEIDPEALADAVIGGLVYRTVVLGQRPTGRELSRLIQNIVASSEMGPPGY